MLNIKVTKKTKQMTNEGFTLVEVMIGMAIFLIGFLAVGSMQIAAINGNAAHAKPPKPPPAPLTS